MPEFDPAMQPDEPLTPFDVTQTSERAGLVKLLIGFGVLLVLAFIVLKLYQPGVRDRTDPPLITAENTPFKVVPEDRDGMQTPDQDKEVFDVMSGQDSSTDVITLPPPEVPISLPDRSEPSRDPSLSETNTLPRAETRPAQIKPADETPVQPTASQPSVSPPPASQDPVSRPTTAATGNSEWIVQVASLRSQGEAETTYAAIKSKNSRILSPFSSEIVRVDLAEKGIYYRARVVGFASRSAANTICNQLKAAGQSCFVTRR